MNKAFFEFLNRLNHTPSKASYKMDAKIGHKESINYVLKRVKA